MGKVGSLWTPLLKLPLGRPRRLFRLQWASLFAFFVFSDLQHVLTPNKVSCRFVDTAGVALEQHANRNPAMESRSVLLKFSGSKAN